MEEENKMTYDEFVKKKACAVLTGTSGITLLVIICRNYET
jgi:hypothetical protein